MTFLINAGQLYNDFDYGEKHCLVFFSRLLLVEPLRPFGIRDNLIALSE